jgi:hypothetical protein
LLLMANSPWFKSGTTPLLNSMGQPVWDDHCCCSGATCSKCNSGTVHAQYQVTLPSSPFGNIVGVTNCTALNGASVTVSRDDTLPTDPPGDAGTASAACKWGAMIDNSGRDLRMILAFGMASYDVAVIVYDFNTTSFWAQWVVTGTLGTINCGFSSYHVPWGGNSFGFCTVSGTPGDAIVTGL